MIRATPQKNEFVEMMNKTLLKNARCMKLNVKIAKKKKEKHLE